MTSLGDKDQWGLSYLFVNIIEEVAHNHAQNAPVIKNWARSCVQAAEQDLLVAYPVIDICGKIYQLIEFKYPCIISMTTFVIIADDRNPSPPPELTGESGEDLIHADSIGDTVFSKHWLFTTLMKLIQVRPKKSPDRWF